MELCAENGESDCPKFRIKDYSIVCPYRKTIGGCLSTPTFWKNVDNGIWRNQLCLVKVIDGGDCTTVGVSHDVILRQRADNDK